MRYLHRVAMKFLTKFPSWEKGESLPSPLSSSILYHNAVIALMNNLGQSHRSPTTPNTIPQMSKANIAITVAEENVTRAKTTMANSIGTPIRINSGEKQMHSPATTNNTGEHRIRIGTDTIDPMMTMHAMIPITASIDPQRRGLLITM
mmetsp:Transcript_17677/g.26484  ORF Transcript_17677/g.26484 Transcript_17677/m.26484 type:complete len:148 (-) Transcript_17677:317-760(-)